MQGAKKNRSKWSRNGVRKKKGLVAKEKRDAQVRKEKKKVEAAPSSFLHRNCAPGYMLDYVKVKRETRESNAVAAFRLTD